MSPDRSAKIALRCVERTGSDLHPMPGLDAVIDGWGHGKGLSHSERLGHGGPVAASKPVSGGFERPSHRLAHSYVSHSPPTKAPPDPAVAETAAGASVHELGTPIGRSPVHSIAREYSRSTVGGSDVLSRAAEDVDASLCDGTPIAKCLSLEERIDEVRITVRRAAALGSSNVLLGYSLVHQHRTVFNSAEVPVLLSLPASALVCRSCWLYQYFCPIPCYTALPLLSQYCTGVQVLLVTSIQLSAAMPLEWCRF
jgi:hypothetical protein